MGGINTQAVICKRRHGEAHSRLSAPLMAQQGEITVILPQRDLRQVQLEIHTDADKASVERI